VFKLLKNLSHKKVTGPDELPPGMLKDVACQIAQPLCLIINRSLLTSIIPDNFKYDIVTPIYKSGVKHDMNNYRPITVLPIYSKILEKCIHNQLMAFLEEKDLLSPTQFGFRRKRNMELAAALFIDKLRKNMEKGKMTGAIFINFNKAFDTLGHGQIIESLTSYGVIEGERELFMNYLFGRSVGIGNEISIPEPVVCGVPQCSILGPLLFLTRQHSMM